MTRIPEWLQPHKNEWRSVGSMTRLMCATNGSLRKVIEENRHRFRCITEASPNNMGMARRYLVKQVWAAAVAYGLDIQPTPPKATQEDSRLQQQVYELQAQLVHAYAQANEAEERNIDTAALTRHLLRARAPLPAPGVYFLMDAKGDVTYVGQSENVLARMSGHTARAFTDVRMIEINRKEQRLQLERTFIALLNPPGNIHHTKATAA